MDISVFSRLYPYEKEPTLIDHFALSPIRLAYRHLDEAWNSSTKPLWQRVIHVFFAILHLCIPYIFYWVDRALSRWSFSATSDYYKQCVLVKERENYPGCKSFVFHIKDIYDFDSDQFMRLEFEILKDRRFKLFTFNSFINGEIWSERFYYFSDEIKGIFNIIRTKIKIKDIFDNVLNNLKGFDAAIQQPLNEETNILFLTSYLKDEIIQALKNIFKKIEIDFLSEGIDLDNRLLRVQQDSEITQCIEDFLSSADQTSLDIDKAKEILKEEVVHPLIKKNFESDLKDKVAMELQPKLKAELEDIYNQTVSLEDFTSLKDQILPEEANKIKKRLLDSFISSYKLCKSKYKEWFAFLPQYCQVLLDEEALEYLLQLWEEICNTTKSSTDSHFSKMFADEAESAISSLSMSEKDALNIFKEAIREMETDVKEKQAAEPNTLHLQRLKLFSTVLGLTIPVTNVQDLRKAYKLTMVHFRDQEDRFKALSLAADVFGLRNNTIRKK